MVALIPGIPYPASMQGQHGNEQRGGAKELDPVPTSVAVASDGTTYLGLLTGFPFPPGSAKVLRVGPDETLIDAANGLTMVIGVAVGPDGQLYASELSADFTADPPAPGQILGVKADGTTEVVIDALVLPNGIAFDKNGNLCVAAMSAGSGPPGAPPSGMIVCCNGV